MNVKYKFPLHLYMIFETLEPVVYTHDNLGANHYVMLFPNNQIYNLSCVLKNEVFFSLNFLVDISAVDTCKFSRFIPEMDSMFSKNRLILFYIFYMYFLKLRLTVFTFYSTSETRLISIDKHYENAGW